MRRRQENHRAAGARSVPGVLPPLRRPPRSARPGFTLLEILITLAAGGLLLACLWSLLGMYSRLFDAGKTKAGNTQLMSGLMRRMTDDLRNAIQDVNPPLPGAVGPQRRFGFFGDSHMLQFDVLQTAWPSGALSTGTALAYGPDLPFVPQATELRTVRYRFIAPATSEPSASGVRAGLTRWELDFETALDNALRLTGEAPAPALGESQETPPSELALLDELAAAANDETLTWIPEVLRTEFRYFDGTGWTSTWNSLQQKALPVAVEVVVDFQARDESPASPPPDASAASPQTGLGSSANEADTAASAGVVSRRLVVYLPISLLRYPARETALAGDQPADNPAEASDVDLQDPAMQLLDPLGLYDDPLQSNDVLLDQPRDNSGNTARTRFRFAWRGGRGGGVKRKPVAQTAPDQWMRGGL